MFVHLNDLDACIRAVTYRSVCRYGDLRYAERSVTSLIEAFDKGYVEICGIVSTESQIDERIRPWMAGIYGDGTSVKGPLGSVGIRYGLIDPATCDYEIEWMLNQDI